MGERKDTQSLGQVGFLQTWGYLSYASGRQLKIWGWCSGEMTEERLKQPRHLKYIPQILCCMLTSEISVSLAMAGRAGGHNPSWEKNCTFTHMRRLKDVWKHVYPSPKGIFSLWTMGLPWPQDVFLGTISLPLFLPFSFYLRQTVCPNICSRPDLWDPCP